MPSEKTCGSSHFYELLAIGQYPGIELNFDVTVDGFFKVTTESSDIGVRITRVNERFATEIKPLKA